MDDEFDTIGFSHVIAAVAVIVFGWGSLWVGSQGIRIAFDRAPSVGYGTAAVIDSSPAPEEPFVVAPSPTATTITPIRASSPSLTVMMAGDMMFDRGIRAIGQKTGYGTLLSGVQLLFATADIAAANLEGPITSNPSKTLLPNGAFTKSFAFTFAPESAAAIKNAGISVVSLANNHAGNFGQEGLDETRKFLTDDGIGWFGSPGNASSSEAVITKNGISVAFVGYHSFEPGFDRVVATVRSLAEQGDFVIVMPHWGTEYAAYASPKMKSQARELAAAGAGAVIGSHPHVVMDHEWIGKVPVFYSLGNLLFDQYFSPDVMKGNVVSLHIAGGTGGAHVSSVDIYDVTDPRTGGVSVDMAPASSERP